MLDFLYQRLDFIFFIYAALFLLVSKKAFINSKLEKGNNTWRLMSLFSLLYATKYIIDAISLSGYNTGVIFDILTAASFLILIEYIVSNTIFFYSRRFLRLTTLWIAILLIIVRILMGEAVTDFITRFLCLVGSFGVGIKILQTARSDSVDKDFKKTLYMVAVFFTAFCILQFVELNTDAYVKWINKSRTELILIFLGMLFVVGLLTSVETYLNKKSLLLGIHRKGYISYIILFFIVILCWIFTEKLANQTNVEFKERLVNRAATAAAAVDPLRVEHLTLSKKDERNPDFIRLKEQLAAVRNINNDIRFLYLMTVKGDNVFFQVDSEDPKSPDYSAPGNIWSEAPEIVKEVYSKGKGYGRINGPYTDEWGTWVSAFVAIKDFDTHQTVSVLGMDIDVRTWGLGLMQGRRLGIMADIVIFVCLIIFLLVYELGQIATEEIKKKESEIRFKNSLLLTQQETSLDGILIIDKDGKILSFNKRFTDMWGIPPEITDTGVDEVALGFVLEKLSNPEQFLEKVNYLYTHWKETSRDEIYLKDGRIFDRYSAFIKGASDDEYYGRVWYFHDITESKMAEDVLKRSEEKFSTVFQRSPMLTSISTLEDGVFIDVNSTFCNALGYEKYEVIGRTSIELGIFRDKKARSVITENMTRDGFIDSFEMELPKKNDGIMIGLYHGTAIDISGKKCLISVIEDITQRKYDEKLIKEKTDELDRFFNASQDIMCMADAKEGRFTRISRSCEKILGYTAEEMDNKRFIDFVHPEDIASTIAATTTLANDGEVTGFTNRYRCKDGSYKWLEWYSTPYEGKVIYATARDITFRQKTLIALQENEEKYRSVVDNVNMGISLIDRNMHILSANSKMRELFPNMDFSKEYCCYKTYNDPPRTEPCTYCPVLKTFQDGQIHSVVVNTVIGQKVVYYKIMSCPVKDADGNVVSAIELVDNITEQTILHNTIRDNEVYFRTIWNTLQAGVAIIDAETYKVVDVNPAALSILKLKNRDDIVGHPCNKYIGHNDCEHCPVMIQGKEVKNRETVFIDAEGKELPVIKTVELVEMQGKKYLLENFIDVTQLRTAQEKLKESEKRFRDIAISTADLVWEFDAKGVLTYCSDNVYNLLGYTKEEFIGLLFVNTIPVDIRADFAKTFAEMVNKKEPFVDYENRFVKKDGSEIIGLINGTPIINDEGELVGYRGMAKDITEKKKIENTLRQLSRAVEQNPACIVITNTDALIEYVNPRFTQLTGYTFEEAKGQNPRILKGGDTPPEYYKTLWDTVTSGNEWKGEFHNKKKNGELYWESASISPIKDANGRTMNYLGLKEDITERKKLEAALHESQEALLRASKIKDDFLSITSHDLKSPLGIVKTSMNLLLDEKKISPAIKEYAELSLRQAKKGLKLITDLLDLEKLESGDVKLELTNFNFSRLIDEIVDDFRSTYKQSGVSLKSYSEGDYKVTADYNKMGQVISNLLGNALKYTSKGGKVSINTTLIEDNLKVSVTDTGEGIPPEKLSKIFEKYEQVTARDRKTGTGMGLSIARYICELHYGEIWVESSELGKGSIFSFTIPYSKEVRELYYDDPSALPYRILIVDDMDDHRLIVRSILKKSKFPCEEARNWREALDKVRTGKFALALLDIDMPDINGYELLEMIRREKTPKQLPIVMLSSKEADKTLCAKFGVSCLIKKEKATTELIKNIKEILKIK